jgi:hypothetical protein
VKHYHLEGSSKTLCGRRRIDAQREGAGSRLFRREWGKEQLRPGKPRAGESERDFLRRREHSETLFPKDDKDCPTCCQKCPVPHGVQPGKDEPPKSSDVDE